MKNSEIIEFTTNEIVERIDTEKSLLTKLKLNHAISPLDNPNQIKVSRRNIARLKTELHKRNLNGNS
ncbi:MAG: 50S ribosomal protein L29 [Bacteroidales bacterium]|jgi:large subunit ribosomal protein L29|nr:50S ribosomal protein L29 [Bacteroidales bacterium]